jgi:hypothetical protein
VQEYIASESWVSAPELHADIMRLRLAIERLTKRAHDAGVLRTDVSWRDITVLSLASANAHICLGIEPPMRRRIAPARSFSPACKPAPTRNRYLAIHPSTCSPDAPRVTCVPLHRGVAVVATSGANKPNNGLPMGRSRRFRSLLVLPCLTTDLVA